MRSTTSASPRSPVDTTARPKDPMSIIAASEVSLPRLYLLRLGYLVIAVGIAVTKWPLIIDHDRPWPLMEGVETCMLVALSLLWFLGIRYPLQMLPVLLFELAWKFIWMIAVVLPLWTSGQMDPATFSVFYACLVVVIPIAVIPWRYVVAHYVTKPGDPWRKPPRDVEIPRPAEVIPTMRQGS
jgi:hypothetical protein